MTRQNSLPDLLRVCLVGLAYFVVAAALISFARFDHGVASLWLATAILLVELLVIDRRQWPITIAACAVASIVATGLFGFGWVAAPVVMIANIAEAVFGAVLLKRFGQDRSYMDSVAGLAVFVIVGCAIPSAGLGLMVATLVNHATGMPISTEWLAWFAGHSLGTIAFTPIVALVRGGEMARSFRQSTIRARVEAVVLMSIMALLCLAIFYQEHLPLLFLPMLPLTVITFRLDRSGCALALVLLAVIGGVASATGHGPLNMLQMSQSGRAQLFQFYLSITLLTILPVSAQLTQRKDLFRRLHDSETRYKLITESSTDIIVTLDRDGLASYASPSMFEITGFVPGEMIGRQLLDLIESNDAAAVSAAFSRVAADPSTTATVEFRGRVASGEDKWFEANIRAINDEQGVATGWVSAIRDISRRKSLELRLAHAATTDSLTGLANRRSFDLALERIVNGQRDDDDHGCVAIFDIDFFKRINDRHGHAIGDLVLETFAQTARSILRGGDHLARLGGEEFGLILAGTDIGQARQICERLRIAVASTATVTPEGTIIRITVSAGIATINGVESPKQVLRAADAALYRAKGAGRDQLAIAA